MKVLVVLFAVLSTAFGIGRVRLAPFPVPRVIGDNIQVNSNARIHGGTPAPEGRFPFMVLVLMENPKGEIFRCSGSLVAKNWVLLAGHCILKGLTTDSFIAIGGKARLTEYLIDRLNTPFKSPIDENAYGAQERRIAAFYVHPDYDPDLLHYDIALLRLKNPFNDAVTVQALSTEKHLVATNCTILGWGLSEGNVFDGHMRYADKKDVVTPFFGCTHKKEGPFICLRRGFGGICQGDSGSPLICNGETWGVASHYVSDEEIPHCGMSLEEYYSDLFPSRDWIKSYISSGNQMKATSLKIMILGTVIMYLSRATF